MAAPRVLLRASVIGFAALLLSMAWVLPPVVARAVAAEPTALILDGSGSMWGKLDDSQKILIVQSVLADRIARLDDDLELAVFGFGHRRAKNCEDVEELLAFSKLDRDLLAKRVGALSPRGKTPLALALERAAAALPADRSSGRILLLTDGADNCRRDACATAAEIAKQTPSRRIDVIAFGVEDNDMPRVSCIAKNSGGALRTARTTAELATAFDDLLLGSGSGDAPAVVSEVEDAKVALVEPSSLSVVARLSANSPELASGVFWRVRSAGEGGSELYAADQPPDRLALPAGTYQVEAQIDRVLARQSVEVAANGPTRVDMVLGAANLKLRAIRPTQGGEAAGTASPADFFYTIYAASAGKDEPGTTIAMSRDAEPVFVLPAGTYRVLAESGLARIERTIKLDAGSNQVEDLTLDIGTLELEARSAPEGPPINRVVYTILVDDPVAATGVREIARSARPAATFALPVGVYTVRAKSGSVEVTDEVSVRAGQVVKHVVVLAAGTLKASARLGGREDAITDLVEYRIVRADTGTELLRSSRPVIEATLGAGRYRLVVDLGEVNAGAEQEFDLAAGDVKELSLEIDAGTVSLGLASVAGRAATIPSRWEIRSEDGRLLWTTTAAAPRFPLRSGTYEAIAAVRGKMLKQRFTLVAGEIKSVEVQPE